MNKQLKRVLAASILPLGLYAAYYAFYPVRDEVVRTHRYVVTNVAHYPHKGIIRFHAKRVLEGNRPPQDTFYHERSPQLEGLRDGDIVVYRDISGETNLGLKIEKILGRKTSFLDWPRQPQIVVVKKQ